MEERTTFLYFTKYFFSAAIIILFLWLIWLEFDSSYFSFAYNKFGFLSLLAVINNAILLIVLSRIRPKSSELLFFTLFVLSLLFWSISDLGLRIVNSEITLTLFFIQIATEIVATVMFFVFTILYLQRKDFLSKVSSILFIFLPAGVFLVLNATTDLFYNLSSTGLQISKYGISYEMGGHNQVFLIWRLLLFFYAFLLLLVELYSTIDQERKSQIRVILLSIAFPIVMGILIDQILPFFSVDTFKISKLFTSIIAIGVTFAIYWYGLFSFSSTEITSKLLETMSEAVLIVDSDWHIKFANKPAYKLLLNGKKNIIGKNLNGYIKNFSEFKSSINVKTKEDWIVVRGETEVPVRVAYSKILDDLNQFQGGVLVLTDISDIREKEKKLFDQVEESKELSDLLIGRELKMIELKEKVKEQS